MTTSISLDLAALDTAALAYEQAKSTLDQVHRPKLSSLCNTLRESWEGSAAEAWSGQVELFDSSIIGPAIENISAFAGILRESHSSASQLCAQAATLVGSFPGAFGNSMNQTRLTYTNASAYRVKQSCANLKQSLVELGTAWNEVLDATSGLTSGNIALNSSLTHNGVLYGHCTKITDFEWGLSQFEEDLSLFEDQIKSRLAFLSDLPCLSESAMGLSPVDQIYLEASRDGKMIMAEDYQTIFYNGVAYSMIPYEWDPDRPPGFYPTYTTVDTIVIDGDITFDVLKFLTGMIKSMGGGAPDEYDGMIARNENVLNTGDLLIGVDNGIFAALGKDRFEFEFQTNGIENRVIITASTHEDRRALDGPAEIVERYPLDEQQLSRVRDYAASARLGFDASAEYELLVIYGADRTNNTTTVALNYDSNGRLHATQLRLPQDSAVFCRVNPGTNPFDLSQHFSPILDISDEYFMKETSAEPYVSGLEAIFGGQ
jgi:hypothetical protein